MNLSQVTKADCDAEAKRRLNKNRDRNRRDERKDSDSQRERGSARPNRKGSRDHVDAEGLTALWEEVWGNVLWEYLDDDGTLQSGFDDKFPKGFDTRKMAKWFKKKWLQKNLNDLWVGFFYRFALFLVYF